MKRAGYLTGESCIGLRYLHEGATGLVIVAIAIRAAMIRYHALTVDTATCAAASAWKPVAPLPPPEYEHLIYLAYEPLRVDGRDELRLSLTRRQTHSGLGTPGVYGPA